MKDRPVAFFDIDGTLFRSSLLIELVDGMIEAGVFPQSAKAEYAAEYDAWKSREGEYEVYLIALVSTFKKYLRGIHYSVFAEIGKQVVAAHGKHIYRYTREMIARLKGEGYFIVAISQSPKTILDNFCATYQFDKVYGRIYEIGPQDRFTGNVVDEFLISNKGNIVERVFQREGGLSRENSRAVGDTESDIPLLEAVEFPLCFNPNAALYAHARLRGWPVVVERKDVIYNL